MFPHFRFFPVIIWVVQKCIWSCWLLILCVIVEKNIIFTLNIWKPWLFIIFVLKFEPVHFTTCWNDLKLLKEWQTMNTLIRCHKMRDLIRVYIFCLGLCHLSLPILRVNVGISFSTAHSKNYLFQTRDILCFLKDLSELLKYIML